MKMFYIWKEDFNIFIMPWNHSHFRTLSYQMVNFKLYGHIVSDYGDVYRRSDTNGCSTAFNYLTGPTVHLTSTYLWTNGIKTEESIGNVIDVQ